MSKRWIQRWGNTYAFVGLTVLAFFWVMDGVTVFRPASSAVAPAQSTNAATRPPGRMFVLLIDSLRYETAISPDLMPSLSALRSQGVWAEVKSSYNAVTVPCLRAAFTGRDDVSVLGFVQNFLHGDAKIESFFSQVAGMGFRTAVYSDVAFLQFGDAITDRFTTTLELHAPGVEDHDDDAVRRGLELFAKNEHEIVIVHVRYTDYAAHKYSIKGDSYRRDFRRADRLLALADAALGAQYTLLVMGDHGHAPDGSHSLGQDVPTFALYRGPQFKRGYDLGLIDITSHRWLLSETFGVKMPSEGYMGGRYPAAFADAPVQVAPGIDVRVAGAQAVPELLWVYLAMLAVFGAALLWSGAISCLERPGAKSLLWLALPPAVLPMPWNAWVGGPAALAIGAWILRKEPTRAWILAGSGLAAALSWHWWGRWLAAIRDRIDACTHGDLFVMWLVIGGVVALTATRRNRNWLVGGIGIAVGFFFIPTNYRYGFVGMMVPFLWLWVIAYFASLVRERTFGGRRGIFWAVGSAAVVFGFTEAFAGIEARHYIFQYFVSAVSFHPLNPETLLWRAVVAKAVIFFPVWPRRWAPVALKILLIAMLHQVQWRVWEPNAWESLALIALLYGGWLIARRRDPETAYAFLIGLLLFLFAYCVRPVRESYFWADCMLAGIVLASRWIRKFPQPENASADYAVLGVVAFIAAGFFSVSWSIEKLEWSRIYTWLPADLVETWAVLLVPWIVVKTCLPFFIARTALEQQFRGYLAWPGDNLRRIVGLKILTLLLVVSGIGMTGTVSNVYLEGVQQLTVMLILWVGLVGKQSRETPDQPAEHHRKREIAHVQDEHRERMQIQ